MLSDVYMSDAIIIIVILFTLFSLLYLYIGPNDWHMLALNKLLRWVSLALTSEVASFLLNLPEASITMVYPFLGRTQWMDE